MRPPLGKTPTHILEPKKQTFAANSHFQRAVNAIRSGDNGTSGVLRDYADAAYDSLAQVLPEPRDGHAFDADILDLIKDIQPQVQQVYQLALAASRYDTSTRAFDEILRVLERILPLAWSRHPSKNLNWSQDHFKFILNQCAVSVLAAAISEDRIDLVRQLFNRTFFVPRDDADRSTFSFSVFSFSIPSFEAAKERLKLNWLSYRGQFLREQMNLSPPKFDEYLQADFLLFIAATIREEWWYCATGPYLEGVYRPLPLFAKAESSAYANQLAQALSMSLPEMKAKLVEFQQDLRVIRALSSYMPSIARVVGAEKIATRP